MTLLELLKRTYEQQKIDLYNEDCTIVTIEKNRQELINEIITKHEKEFRNIINSEVTMIDVTDNYILRITIKRG